MKKFFTIIRPFFFILAVVVSLSLCGIRLMKIQIVNGAEYLNQSQTASVYKQAIRATRGEIVDKNFQPIVQNKSAYNVIVEKAFFPYNNKNGNEVLIKTYRILKSYGIDYIESIPITKEKPYEFVSDKDSEIEKLKSDINLNVYATAENCIDKLIDDYEISDEYSDEEKRIIAGLRYEMLVKSFSISNRFTMAESIPNEAITEIKENRIDLPGVDIEEVSKREYVQGDIIPHEIGTVGPIYAEEYKELKYKGYSLDDILGKSGIEAAMEDELRGINGVREIATLDGAVVSSKVTQEVQPGNTVKLTIDSNFQKQTQSILENFIQYLNNNTKFTNITSGAIVVLDAKTGAVLSMATAPTYNLNDYINNYEAVANMPNTPLVNRATDGLYKPGSTFKTITATAGLNEGIVTPTSTFYCSRDYEFYGSVVHCTGYHGSISVTRAIEVSCNIYFYEVGRRLGIDKIAEYAQLYGFGQSLGLESGDSEGYVACPETAEKLGVEWTVGDVIQAAIGQSDVAVTPLQMASLACTLANKGTRYKPYLVDEIYNYNMTDLIKKTEPVVSAQVTNNTDIYKYIQDGMIAASHNTPYGEYSLNNLGFDVAIKTGTPQVSSTVQNSTFIGYAPADDPQIAFAGIIEGGEYSKYMIRKIIDAYFSNSSTTTE